MALIFGSKSIGLVEKVDMLGWKESWYVVEISHFWWKTKKIKYQEWESLG